MATTGLGKMLDEVKRLSSDEQRQLREAIDRLLSVPSEPEAEDQFEQELVEAGVLDAVPHPASAVNSFSNGKPVEVKGKPISETIVEDRR
jgi:hypothetical protein